MLSDEEKKAIDWFREDLAEEKENCGKYNDYKKQVIRRNERLLNLIAKQSKEIEELKENNKLLQENYSSAHEDINWFCENYISQKESEQKERKAYIKGTNDADKLCNKKWKDKIKAKIEEVKEEKEHYLEINDEYNAQICDCIIEEYESLLEKE